MNNTRAITLSLSYVEAEILLIWMANASHTSWTDKPTRKAMGEFADKLLRKVQGQCPSLKVITENEMGNFS